MRVDRLQLGVLQTNTYLAIDEDKRCVVVDPGGDADILLDHIRNHELKVVAILVTHGHFDHIGAVEVVSEALQVSVYAHQYEAMVMADDSRNLSTGFFAGSVVARANQYMEDGEMMDFGGELKFKVLEVPGHTEHSLCFYHESGVLFCGDTLFRMSIGRTDLYSGAPTDLVSNIRKTLMILPQKTRVCPGHGDETTIMQEDMMNPFL